MSISITLLDQNFNVNDLDKVVFKPCSLSLPATAAWGDKNMVLIFFFILQISIFVFLKFLNLLFSKFLILCFCSEWNCMSNLGVPGDEVLRPFPETPQPILFLAPGYRSGQSGQPRDL